MSKFIDITGQKFGLLTAKYYIGKGGSNGRKSMWYCECDCGGNKVVSTSELRSGYIKSCGCMHKDNLLGQKFNRLTVLERLPELDKKNNQRWLCKCDCGSDKQVVACTYDLKSDKVKSCGCLQIENGINIGKGNKKYNQYDLSGEYGIGYTFKGEEFYFDLEDYNIIKDYCWSINADGYVWTKSSELNKHITMHRLVLNIPETGEVDHINIHRESAVNKRDNRKENLRNITKQQNDFNRPKQSNNTSGYTGVYKKENKFTAKLTLNQKNIWLGTFNNLDDAIIARLQAELKYFGKEFAPQRHLFEKYNIQSI